MYPPRPGSAGSSWGTCPPPGSSPGEPRTAAWCLEWSGLARSGRGHGLTCGNVPVGHGEPPLLGGVLYIHRGVQRLVFGMGVGDVYDGMVSVFFWGGRNFAAFVRITGFLLLNSFQVFVHIRNKLFCLRFIQRGIFNNFLCLEETIYTTTIWLLLGFPSHTFRMNTRRKRYIGIVGHSTLSCAEFTYILDHDWQPIDFLIKASLPVFSGNLHP